MTGRKIERKLTTLAAVVLLALSMSLMVSCGGDGDEKETQLTETEATKSSKETSVTDERDPDELLATIFFASDYQEVEGLSSPGDNLASVLERISSEGITPEMTVFCGDYTNDRKLHDYQMSPEGSIDQIRGIVRERIPKIDDEDMLFVQGNHDSLSESIAESGLHEYDDYLIYVLNTQNDFPWKQGKTSGCLKKVEKAAADMKTCFDQLPKRGERRPVFIAGHVPIHFTARTSSRHTTGDNLYSSLIFDVVNEAGKSLDIVYFFGHNHSKGWDCYMGGSSVYKAKGDTLLIPQFDESKMTTDGFTEEKLEFTYLNAGYIGYYMNCGPEEYDAGEMADYEAADGTLTGTVCLIYPNRMELSRYACDGENALHSLGSAGEGDPYKGGIDSGLIGEEHYARETDSPKAIPRK